MLDNGIFKMTRGDRQRLPSWDDTQYITLDTLDSTDIDETDVPDLTDRTVDLSLVTKARGGDRIALSNSVEIGDPTAGEVAIVLEESDTAVPIEGGRTNLYGEFRISGGTEDPTTAGTIKIELYPSRHDVEGEAQLLPYVGDFGDFAIDGVMDAEGASITNVSLDAESLENAADYIVNSVDELQTAVANITNGETIWVGRPATPYRTTETLMFDAVDGWSLIFQSRYAEDGQPIIIPADGSNVGGVQVNNGCTGWKIEGMGYSGNPDNQDPSVFNLDGIRVTEGYDFAIRDIYVERTSPYHVHNDGGSGITIASPSANYRVENIRSDDIGDRALQTNASWGTIDTIYSTNGFDRTLSIGGNATNVNATNIYSTGNSEGSIVGVGRDATSTRNITVSNVIAQGDFHASVRVKPSTENVVISNVNAELTGDRVDSGIFIEGGDTINISDSILTGYAEGVRVDGSNVEVSNVTAKDTSQYGFELQDAQNVRLLDCKVNGADNRGIFLNNTTDSLVRGCEIRNYSTEATTDTQAIGVGASTTGDSDGNRFEDNRVYRNSTAPLSFEGGTVTNSEWVENWGDDKSAAFNINTTEAAIVRGNLPRIGVDVRNLLGTEGNEAFHDGSGTDNTRGPATYISGGWVSLVDGSAIA